MPAGCSRLLLAALRRVGECVLQHPVHVLVDLDVLGRRGVAERVETRDGRRDPRVPAGVDGRRHLDRLEAKVRELEMKVPPPTPRKAAATRATTKKATATKATATKATATKATVGTTTPEAGT